MTSASNEIISQTKDEVKRETDRKTDQDSEQNVNTVREKETPEQNAGKSFAAAIEGNRARTQTDNGKATGKASDGWVILDDGTKVQYQIKRTTEGTPVVVVEENELFSVSDQDIRNMGNKYKKIVRNIIRNLFKDSVKIHNSIIGWNSKLGKEYTYSEYSKNLLRKGNQEIYADKMRAAPNMAEAIYAATDWVEEAPKHPRKDNIVSFGRGNVLLKIGEKTYKAEVVISYDTKNVLRFHDLVSLQKKSFKINESGNPKTQIKAKSLSPRGGTALIDNISQIEGDVKEGINGKSWRNSEQNVNTTQAVFPDITDSFYIAELYPLSLWVKSRIISLIFIFCGHTASQARQPRHAEGFLLSSRELRAMGALNPPPE